MMKKLLLAGALALASFPGHAQSTCPQCMGDGFPHPNYQGPAFGGGYTARRVPQVNSHGACGSLCQTKCQGAWRALGFRSVNACVARWAKLNAEGTAAACETAIKANGMRPIRGC